MSKKRIIVVMPGRGSYGAAELDYLNRFHSDLAQMIEQIDAVVKRNGGTAASTLDRLEKYSPAKHLPGRNASNLIYACALADFAAIDRSKYEIVAICGNSLGWYLTLAASGVLSLEDGAHLVDTMGGLMENEATGGQFLYPLTNDAWQLDPEKIKLVQDLLQSTPNAYYSINLCGTAVLAGDDAAVKAMMAALPKIDNRFPMRLPKHAAFHTPLLSDIAETARGRLGPAMMGQPSVPIIDGRGQIWRPKATDQAAIYDYTLGTQITDTYDFAKSLDVAAKEFAPDGFVLTGPGATLGPPIAQSFIQNGWYDIHSKQDFSNRQNDDPVLLSMGRPDQRNQVI